MEGGRKSAAIRTTFHSVGPWTETCRCTEFHQIFSKNLTCRLKIRKQDGRIDRKD